MMSTNLLIGDSDDRGEVVVSKPVEAGGDSKCVEAECSGSGAPVEELLPQELDTGVEAMLDVATTGSIVNGERDRGCRSSRCRGIVGCLDFKCLFKLEDDPDEMDRFVWQYRHFALLSFFSK